MNATSVRPCLVLLCVAWAACLGAILLLSEAAALDDRGNFLIRNTVRLALLFWVIAVVRMLLGSDSADRSVARIAWTLGCLAYLIHVDMAFEFAHRWSHTAAFEHVKHVGGVGEGIFVNYLFTFLWMLDVGWWWLDRSDHEKRRRWMGWALHGFMVFIIVNAVVVFANGPIRWIGAVTFLGLGYLLLRRGRRERGL